MAYIMTSNCCIQTQGGGGLFLFGMYIPLTKCDTPQVILNFYLSSSACEIKKKGNNNNKELDKN